MTDAAEPRLPADDAALALNGLSKAFPGAGWVIRNLTLAVRRGEILSVLGPSGCGKSTLLRLIGGFEIPERGEVYQGGRLISGPGWALPPERRGIGMVFQESTLFPHLSVRENVMFGRTSTWLGRLWPAAAILPAGAAARSQRGRPAPGRGLIDLLALTGLVDLAERYPHELSGGQQQRVALARALAVEPRLLLLDEPFSNLDSSLRQRMREEVWAILKQSGTTSILVTHDQEEAINMGDRLAVLSQRGLEQVGTPEQVLQRPCNRFVAAFLGFDRFLPGRVEHGLVHTELGAFPLPSEEVNASRVDVLLRPNQVHLSENSAAVRAEVIQRRYLGGQPIYTMALPSGLHIQARLPESIRLRPGDRVGIRCEPFPLVIYPAD
jgi:iron(III) transport system ATP-binding protein